RVSIGGGYLYGVISPPDSFDEVSGTNEAKMYEENLRYTQGLGHGFLKDMFVEMESKTFQSGQETVNGAVVHPANNGWILNARSGGNFVHTPRFLFGTWIEAGSPVLLTKAKFVNPSVNYVGIGFKMMEELSRNFGLIQTAFVGSGLFLPRNQNPNVKGSFLVIMNIGKMAGGGHFTVNSGGLAQADLTARVDSAYQASALGSGRIKKMLVSTPFLLEWSFNREWSIDGGYVMKWVGRSVAGSRYAVFNLTREF
ncbi:MAG: hypothetical protein U1D33_02040, partial [bacterium]|nr:hypothetical protein [bacterium]